MEKMNTMKNNKWRQILIGVLLTFVLLISALAVDGFPIYASAADGEPSLVDGVYQLDSADDLMWFASLVNGGTKDANAVLTADIDMSGVTNYVPIGDIPEEDFQNNVLYIQNGGYEGTFDGQGHIIKNLTMPSNFYHPTLGVFGTVIGTVKNVGLDNYNYYKDNDTHDGRYGALVGLLGASVYDNGTIENCYVVNSSVDANNKVGGIIAGANYGGTIQYCYTYNCSVSGYTAEGQERYGHIVGDNKNDGIELTLRTGSVRYCYTDGARAVSTQNGYEFMCEESVSAERFASGEIAYLLANNSASSPWGQTVGTDALPSLSAPAVSRYTLNNCGNEFISYVYSNVAEENGLTRVLDHTGGTATCSAKAICEACGSEYGELNPNNHVGGTATCSAKAVCEACGSEYGEVNSASHLDANDDHSCDGCGAHMHDGIVFDKVWTPPHYYGYTDLYGGNYYLAEDVTNGESATIRIAGDVKLCLCNHSLDFGKFGKLIVYSNDSVFEIYDCGTSGTIKFHPFSVGSPITNNTILKIHGGTIKIQDESIVNNALLEISGGSIISTGVDAIKNTSSGTIYLSGDAVIRSETSGNSGIYRETINDPSACKVYAHANGDPSDIFTGKADISLYTLSEELVAVYEATKEQLGSFNIVNPGYVLKASDDNLVLHIHDNVSDDGDCTTPVICPSCNGISIPAKSHSFDNDCVDPDCNNEGCTYTREVSHTYAENGFCTVCHEPQAPACVDGVYQIGKACHLVWFSNLVNGGTKDANAVLIADIDMNGVSYLPIGNIAPEDFKIDSSTFPDTGYAGTFDGQGHIIKNLTTPADSASSTSGVFGTVSGTVKNLGVDNYYYKKNNNVDGRFGAIVGMVISGGRVEDCFVLNSTVIARSCVVGAIAGANYAGTIQNCFSYYCSIEGYTSETAYLQSDWQYRYGYIVGDTRNDSTSGPLNGTVINCYTNGWRIASTQEGTVTGCEAYISAERFASGEIAYLLKNGTTASMWGQTLGIDALPSLNSETVYRVTITQCDGKTNLYEYENGTADRSEAIDHKDEDGDKYCDECGKFLISGSGTKDDPYIVTAVDELNLLFGSNGVVYIRLGGDITASSRVTAVSADTTAHLDLNGFTLDIGEKWFSNNGTLELCDSGVGGSLVGSASPVLNNSGFFTLTSGTIKIKDGSGILARPVTNEEGGEIVINGGTVSGSFNGSINSDGGKITINGGTVDELKYCYNTELVVNGGVIASISWERFGSLVTLDITGGTIGSLYISNCDEDGNPVEMDVVTISGGTVTKISVSGGSVADCLAMGYVFYDEAGTRITLTEGQTELTGTVTVAECTDHEGGTATCTTLAACDICGAEYGTLAEHTYDTDGFCTKCGTSQEPELVDGVYQIGNAGNLVWFSNLVNDGTKNANAVLTADIDMEGVSYLPIGNIASEDFKINSSTFPDTGYSGIFDGQGFIIKNLTTPADSASSTSGVFGTVSGTVKNLGVDNYYYQKNNNVDGRFGAIVGMIIPGGVVEDCFVLNSTVIATSRVVGAIAGANYAGTIQNCFSYNCKVEGYTSGKSYRYGYIVGDTRNDSTGTDTLIGTVTNCYTDGWRIASTQEGTVTGCEAYISAERFASGEIAYLLKNGNTASMWGQTAGIDTLPTFGSEKVIRVTVNNCNEAFVRYEYENGTADYTDVLDHIFSVDDGKCTVCHLQKAISVTVGSIPYFFDSFSDAIAKAEEGTDATPAAIKLYTDITVAEAITMTGGVATLDLNGKTLTFTYVGGNCWTLDGASLKVDDTSIEQTGEVYSEFSADPKNCYCMTLTNSSVLTWEGGTLNGSSGFALLLLDDSQAVQNGGTVNRIIYVDKGTYVLNDGLINGNFYSHTDGNSEEYVTNLVLNGGTISLNMDYIVRRDFSTDFNVTVTGGTFDYHTMIIFERPSEMKLSGGTFSNGISLTHWDDFTLKDALAPGYLYYDENGNIITLSEGQMEIAGRVTVGVCTHSFGDYLSDAEGHWHECKACGATDTKAEHSGTDDGVCDACGTVLWLGKVGQVSVTLDGDIGVNFYWTLGNSVINDSTAYLLVTLPNGQTEKIMVSDAPKSTPVGSSTEYYKITGNVAAKEMAEAIKVELFVDGAPVASGECSVRDYAKRVFAYSDDADLIAMMKAMLNYGATSQMLFDHNTDDLANSILEDGDKTVTTVTTNDVTPATLSGSVTGIKNEEFSCILETKTTLRHYFSLTEGEISDYQFAVDRTPITPIQTVKNGKTMYYVDIPNISARDLGVTYDFTITKGETQTISASVQSYMSSVIRYSNDASLIDAVNAMYAYNQAAIAYFSN